MAWDPTAAYQRLTAMEKKEMLSNEKVRTFLAATAGARYKEFIWGDVTLRIVPAITGELRADIDTLHKYSGDVWTNPDRTLEQVDAVATGIYTLLAHLCLDEPFTVPQTWELIDDEQNTAFNLLGELIHCAASPYEGMKSFR